MKSQTTSASGALTLPSSIERIEDIVRQGREKRDLPCNNRMSADEWVERLAPAIRLLQNSGHRQEDAVILVLELSGDAHRPDTIRKAIAKAIGRWSIRAEVTSVSPSADAQAPQLAPVNSAPSAEADCEVAIEPELVL